MYVQLCMLLFEHLKIHFVLVLQVFPLSALRVFSEDELERLLCGEQDNWDVCACLLLGFIDFFLSTLFPY